MASPLALHRIFPAVVYAKRAGTQEFEQGWSLSRLKRKPGSEVLTCFICNRFPRRPFGTPCAKIACDFCLFKWFRTQGIKDGDEGLKGRCPGCNSSSPMFSFRAFRNFDATLRRVLLDFNIRCPCGFYGDLLAMEKHELLDCPRRIVQCPNPGCKVQLPAWRMEETHFQQCTFFILKCAKCELRMCATELETHNCIEELKKQLKGA